MLSFPSSPRSGQSYAAPNGQIYVYDGVKWIGTTVSGGGGGATTVTNNIENPFTFNVAADDSTQREILNGELIKFIGAGSITTASDAEGNITITGSSSGVTASSSDTFTNKTINIAFGQGNTFQIQGNSISSYTGSGPIVALSSMPTLSGFNIGNGSNLTVDGGTGPYYWSGQSGVAQAGIDKAGVYRSGSSSTNSLFTFAANGSGTMSAAVEGSLFVGTALPSNNGGLNTDYSGWLVVQSGGKFGGDLNTRGSLIFDDALTGAVVFADGSRQTTAWDTGYLSFDDAALRGTSGYQYTFNTDGYFTSSTSSESPNYFFVTYNSTNLNIAAGWTVVGANCDTTVSSVVYPVAGYPGVIKVNLTASASSTSGFYPVVVTSPDRLKVQIQPNPGTASKYTFTTAGLTFPDNTIQTTAWTGVGDIRGSVFADDSTLLVDGTGAKIVGEIDSPKIRTTAESIALGNRSGYTNQSAFSIALGWYAGNSNQQSGSVAIGVSAGQTTQDLQSVAIGYYTGASNQGSYSVAIGTGSGGTNQSSNSVAIGSSAGAQSQGNASIAIGGGAGRDSQGGLSIAIGNAAAYENQGIYAISIGAEAGRTSQGWNAISIGSGAGRTSQGADAVAIGNGAGYTGQGEKSVAIGYNVANPNQGSHSVAIGPYAGAGSAQAANSIAINASSLGGFSPSTTGFFVNPLRNVDGGKFLNYNTSTYEIGYSNDLVSENDINIRVNSADSTQNVWTFGEDGSFTVANGISSFEKFEVKINGNDSTLSTFRFGEDGSIELPNRAQIRPSSTAYDAALSGWESFRAAEEESATQSGITAATRPYIAWNVTGENAAEYLAELTRVWQIQQTYPDNGPLVWTPAISSALYTQMRSVLNVIIGAYPGVGNDVSISVQSSSWATSGKSWNFGIDGNLTFPDGAKYAGQTVTMPTTTFSNTNSFVWEFSDNVAGSDRITLNWNLLASDTGTFYIGTTHSTNGKYLILDGTNQSLSYFVGGNVGAGKLKFGASTNGGAGGGDDIELTTSSTGSVRIETDNNSWAFGPDGLLSLGASSGGIHSDQTTGRIIIGDSLSSNGAPSAPSNSLTIGGDSGFVARISGYSTGIQPVWTFNEDLSMQIPGDIKSDSNINIEINGVDSTKRIWQFGEDGNLETPGDITASGNITGNILKIEDGVHEKVQSLADATGVITHDCSLGHVFYHTSPDANWTANFTNLNLASGYATTVSLIIVQGGTGYYPNAVQIGGSAQTILWQGNTTPTVSTNRTDVASFSIINNSGTYVVLGQITGF